MGPDKFITHDYISDFMRDVNKREIADLTTRLNDESLIIEKVTVEPFMGTLSLLKIHIVDQDAKLQHLIKFYSNNDIALEKFIRWLSEITGNEINVIHYA